MFGKQTKKVKKTNEKFWITKKNIQKQMKKIEIQTEKTSKKNIGVGKYFSGRSNACVVSCSSLC